MFNKVKKKIKKVNKASDFMKDFDSNDENKEEE